ncbi:Hypothetical protein SRAE_2000051500 [Strongyloides ratti]|uniref:Uncharacterized protein n=1 Tax=Strongyloides ratti TaxID=34506 RepID=A0A090LEB2_STRRB|nr:Hypothetical protein SRAE_2000051500 [Strongyloides ratti]CEF65840.1 Hypothetical protein SRAE_2000051500 [Strongyloides ratti]
MALHTKLSNPPDVKSIRRSEEIIKKSQSRNSTQNSGLMDSILCQMDEIHAPSVVDIQPSYNTTTEELYLNYQTLERNHQYWSRQKPILTKDIDLMTRLIWYKSMRGRVDAYARMSITHKEEFFSSLSGDWMDPLDKDKYSECLNKHGKGPRTPPGSPCTSLGGGVIPTDTSPTSEGLTKIYDSVGDSDYYDGKNVLLNELAASTRVSVSEVEKAIGKDLENVIKGVNKETLLATLKSALLNLSTTTTTLSKETNNKISEEDGAGNVQSSDEMSLVSSSDGNSTIVSILPPPPPPEDIMLLANKIIESPPEPPTFNLEVKYPMSTKNMYSKIDSNTQQSTNIYSSTPPIQRSQEIFPILNLSCNTPPPLSTSNMLYRGNDQSNYVSNKNKKFCTQTLTPVHSNLKRKFDKSSTYRNNKNYNKNVDSTPLIPSKYKCIQMTSKNINNTMNYSCNNSNQQPKRIPTVDLTAGISSNTPIGQGVKSTPTGMVQQNTLRMIPPPSMPMSSNNIQQGLGMLSNIITMNQNPYGPGRGLPTNTSSIYGPPVGMNNNPNFIKGMKPNNNTNFGTPIRCPPPSSHSLPPPMMPSTLGTNFWKR